VKGNREGLMRGSGTWSHSDLAYALQEWRVQGRVQGVGVDEQMWCLQVGSILFTVVIVTVHLEVASVLDHWTPFHHLSIWVSVCKRLTHYVDSHIIYSAPASLA